MAVNKPNNSTTVPMKKPTRSLAGLFEDRGYFLSKVNAHAPSNMEQAYMGRKAIHSAASFEEKYRGSPGKRKAKQDLKTFFDPSDVEYVGFDLPSRNVTRASPLSGMLHHGRTPARAEEDSIDVALALAKDFVRKNRVINMGGSLFFYNRVFYERLIAEDAQRRIFRDYEREVSRASPLSKIRNAAALLELCVPDNLEEFPQNEGILVFENGTLELHTRLFRKNSPADLASSALGIRYDADRWDMPNTEMFLRTIADGDPDLYERLLQVLGYILSNDLRAKSFFYLEGVGNAGKSRFCDLVASFFPKTGANKVSRVALQDFGEKFALGNLVNSKVNISEDLPDKPLTPTAVSRIKMISDSNRLEAEAKYVQPFSFRPQCKLLFASNHPLRVKEYDEAFLNRVCYLPFLHAIPKQKQDPSILEKMQDELPALFNRSLRSYQDLVFDSYRWAGGDKFQASLIVEGSGIPADKRLAIQDFVDTCCEFVSDATISTEELQTAYLRFCQGRGYPIVQGDRFSRELSGVLPDSVRRVKIGNTKRGFQGILLRRV